MRHGWAAGDLGSKQGWEGAAEDEEREGSGYNPRRSIDCLATSSVSHRATLTSFMFASCEALTSIAKAFSASTPCRCIRMPFA